MCIRDRSTDDEVDEHYNALFRELLTYMMGDPRTIKACTHLLFMAKNLERIGDHATNTAETVHYEITGEEMPVSYTHLDVYKRQSGRCSGLQGRGHEGPVLVVAEVPGGEHERTPAQPAGSDGAGHRPPVRQRRPLSEGRDLQGLSLIHIWMCIRDRPFSAVRRS